jgi:protoheme IX farnesyltransferase
MTPPAPSAASFRDYLELTKPRLSLLSVLTSLVGYYCTRPASNPVKLTLLLVGTSLAAGGVAALNQWMESDTDRQMRRTADRPIPAGKVAPGSAFVLGWLMCIAALFLLFARVDKLAAMFTLFTIVSYLGWYTPAKRFSPWSTEIGAIAGAFPPSSAGRPAKARFQPWGGSSLACFFSGRSLTSWRSPGRIAVTIRRCTFPCCPCATSPADAWPYGPCSIRSHSSS